MQTLRSRLRGTPGATAALILTTAAAAWLGGCSSDMPNETGAGLVDPELTAVLVELPVQNVTAYSPLTVEDPELPVHRQQVLYVGSRNGVSSRLLVNYDFADIFTEDHPDTLFTAEHIKAVKLSLTKLKHYSGFQRQIIVDGDTTYVPSGQPLDLYYRVQQLTAPFDSTAYVGFPGVVPPYDGVPLNSDYNESVQSSEPLLRLYEDDFLDWLSAGQTVGMVISFGVGSDEGLVGFAARELKRYGELDDVAVGTIVAPNLVIEFEDNTVLNFLLPPVADTSTFETVPSPPATLTEAGAGFMLRTCLRSYPTLDFDFSGLPEDVLINRAVLRLVNDDELAFGNREAIVVAEFDSVRAAAVPVTLTPAELVQASYVITGQVSLDPTEARELAFDVTVLVQRLVNDVYPEPRGLVLAAAEDGFTTYDLTTVDPDFYFTEFRFFGPAAVDSLRPRLEITYSRHDERMGGAR